MILEEVFPSKQTENKTNRIKEMGEGSEYWENRMAFWVKKRYLQFDATGTALIGVCKTLVRSTGSVAETF